jgi:DNA-binding NtrC family response regulator
MIRSESTPPRVLVLDSDPGSLCKHVEDLQERFVLSAVTTVDAAIAMRPEKYEAVVVDLPTPAEVIAFRRALDERGTVVPLVLVSWDPAIADCVKRGHAFGYLTRPFTGDELTWVVSHAVSDGQDERAAPIPAEARCRDGQPPDSARTVSRASTSTGPTRRRSSATAERPTRSRALSSA